jgi:hypothetical protein
LTNFGTSASLSLDDDEDEEVGTVSKEDHADDFFFLDFAAAVSFGCGLGFIVATAAACDDLFLDFGTAATFGFSCFAAADRDGDGVARADRDGEDVARDGEGVTMVCADREGDGVAAAARAGGGGGRMMGVLAAALDFFGRCRGGCFDDTEFINSAYSSSLVS